MKPSFLLGTRPAATTFQTLRMMDLLPNSEQRIAHSESEAPSLDSTPRNPDAFDLPRVADVLQRIGREHEQVSGRTRVNRSEVRAFAVAFRRGAGRSDKRLHRRH